jgi:nucleoside-diphosphate-sugar epimerase
MRVLLTGATGNIGRSALQQMVDHGHHIRALVTDLRSARRSLSWALASPQVELVVGDVRDQARMMDITRGQDAVVHLAYILPPQTDEQPELAKSVNLDGTRNLIDAALAQPTPPRFVFASSFDLYGDTTQLQPPRSVDDPIVATDLYTEHKIAGERMLQESGLTWCILRFADIPVMGYRSPHPIMYEIPLAQRFEVLHTLDAGLALNNVLDTPEAWNHIWLIGGGADCQVTYGEYLFALLRASGLSELPAAAFTTSPYCTDWLDTRESEALLHYQRHSFADIVAEVSQSSRLTRQLLVPFQPVARAFILRLSPYWKNRERRSAAV